MKLIAQFQILHPKPRLCHDVMEDMLAMVRGDSEATTQDEEASAGEVPAKHPEMLARTMAAALPSSSVHRLPPSAQPSGEHFIAWLKQGIASRRLIINDAKALVHTVSDTVFLVSPGVFQRYAQEHPQVGMMAKQENQQDWQWVQKRFERLQQHRKQCNGLNIRKCEVSGPRKTKRLHGYLLMDPHAIFLDVPSQNPYLSLCGAL